MKRQLEANQPKFALFYGVSYRKEYEAIAGPFNADGWRWTGKTLCVLTKHPTPRRGPAPPASYWRALGMWKHRMVTAGPDGSPDPMPDSSSRPPSSLPSTHPTTSSPAARSRSIGASSLKFAPHDPKHTIDVLDQLVEGHHFAQRRFRQLHHSSARASIRKHIAYCRDLQNPFTSQTNATVAQRLQRVLGYLDAGQRMDQTLQRVVIELPMPR
jgi:hypothetical protein